MQRFVDTVLRWFADLMWQVVRPALGGYGWRPHADW
jgi:hypothetical protein